MLRLEEIERSYYSAIDATKLKDANPSDGRVLRYEKEAFQDWVKRLDIYDLDNEMADFYVDEEIVETFTAYRDSLAAELPKYTKYDGVTLNGQIKNIGSCQDGSKVGKMNEADSLYVLDADNFTIINDDSGDYHVFLKQTRRKCKVIPRSIRHQFANGYAEVIAKLPLPKYLNHAGCNSPTYSGLRYNGPAATSQFLTDNGSLLTWDMTPALRLDRWDIKYQEVRDSIQPALEMNRNTMFGDMGIHLIPDANEDVWRLSTAQLEADLLRELIPPVAPIRVALSNSKVLASQVKIWNAKNLTPPVCVGTGLNITQELEAYLKGGEKEFGRRLNQKLRYAYIWIPPDKRRQYREDEKSHVSINTAAIKHILLSAALKNPKAFAGKEDRELVRELMILVFNTLGDPTQFSSPHAFLKGTYIPHMSVLSSQASNKTKLVLSIKEQCRLLVRGAMTKVSQRCFSFRFVNESFLETYQSLDHHQ